MNRKYACQYECEYVEYQQVFSLSRMAVLFYLSNTHIGKNIDLDILTYWLFV